MQPAATATQGSRWWVLHTKARNEKVLAGALRERDIHAFLPLVRASRLHRKRRVFVDLPLFPGYVFLYGDDSERQAAVRTNRVANVIEVKDQARIDTELDQINQLIRSNESVKLFPGLVEGREVRVVSGPLKGVTGVIVGKRRRQRLHIAATVLGQSATVEIDPAWVEPVF